MFSNAIGYETKPCCAINILINIFIFSASSCRGKVQRYLQKKFSTPKEAQAHYSDIIMPHQVILQSSTEVQGVEEIFAFCRNEIAKLESEQQVYVISQLFSYFSLNNSRLIVPGDFLFLAQRAMRELKGAGRSNVVYNLVKAIGTKRPDGSDSLLPVRRMPMGLLEYCGIFFTSTRLEQVNLIFLCLFMSR